MNKPNLEEQASILCSKKYWDYANYESQKLDIEKKLLNLASFVADGGDLIKLVERYKKNDIYLNTITETIIQYINYLREGEYITGFSEFYAERLSQEDLLLLLSAELKRHLTIDVDGSGDDLKIIPVMQIGGYNAEEWIDESLSPKENTARLIYGGIEGLELNILE